MKIAITFEHTDLIKFIEEMLAMKGMKAAEPIVFQRKRNKGPQRNAIPGVYEVMVMCEDAPPLEVCPMCQHSLRSEPAASPAPAHVATARVSEPLADPEEPVSLMAGESVEPPFGNPSAPTDGEGGDGGGMAAIIAQSRAIEASKKREQEARRFGKKPRNE